jgi:hypothetical protein
LLVDLRWLSTASASYPRKITKNITFNRFQSLSVEIIEEKNREKVIHSQFILPCSRAETRHFAGTQVVQINI